MISFTLREKKNALRELIDQLGLTQNKKEGQDVGDPIVIDNSTTEEEVDELLLDAISIFKPDEDEVSADTLDVVNNFAPDAKSKTFDDDGNIEQEETDDEQLIKEVINDIKNAGNMRELKDIANAYEEFGKIRSNLTAYKNIDILREEMLIILGVHEAIAAPFIPEEKVEEEAEEKEPVKKKTPAPKKEKARQKPAPKEKYTRTMAVAEILRINPNAPAKKVVQEAEALYIKYGGEANPRHTRYQYGIVIQVLKVFEIIK